MTLQITQNLKEDIFGQFKGIYLSDEQHKLEIFKENSEGKDIVFLNKGDFVTIDFLYLSVIKEFSTFTLPVIIESDNFIVTSYAKNPQKGCVIVITGKFLILN
jgi:hypothetical protein